MSYRIKFSEINFQNKKEIFKDISKNINGFALIDYDNLKNESIMINNRITPSFIIQNYSSNERQEKIKLEIVIDFLPSNQVDVLLYSNYH